MENQIVEAQEAPKSMMMQRKSRVRERADKDEEELKELLAEQNNTKEEAEAKAKEEVEPEAEEPPKKPVKKAK